MATGDGNSGNGHHGPLEARNRVGREGLVVHKGLFELQIDREGSSVILTLRGELDLATAALLESTLLKLEAEDVGEMVLDLSQLEFCDSSGLQVILQAATRDRQNGNRLSLLKGGPEVQRLFQLTSLEDELPFVD